MNGPLVQVSAHLNEAIQQRAADATALGLRAEINGVFDHTVEHGTGGCWRSTDPAKNLRVIIRLNSNEDRRHDFDVLKFLEGQRSGLVSGVTGVEALLVDLTHLRVVRCSEGADAEILLLVVRVFAHDHNYY